MGKDETSTPRPHSDLMEQALNEFFGSVRSESVEIYNEFSFQHELGIHLRNKVPDKKVQFERNVSHFFPSHEFVKNEIDIAVFSKDKSEMTSVCELKFPRNGQYPEQMYSFCKDIVFLEQLVKAGFENAYFIAVADDRLFYSGDKKDGIYSFFRSNKPIEGKITKPTGRQDDSVVVEGSYYANWNSIRGGLKYCVVEVRSAAIVKM